MTDQHHMVLEAGRADRLAHRHHLLARLGLGRLGQRLLAPRRVDVERGEQQRIDENADDGAGQDQVAALFRQQAERQAAIGEDEGKLADLRQRGRDHQRGGARVPKQPHDQERRQRFADQDDEHGGEQRQGRIDHDARIEQHSDRDEEQHGEGVAQRQRLGRGLLAQLQLAQHHAGEEGAKRERDAEQLGGGVGDAERDRQHGEAE